MSLTLAGPAFAELESPSLVDPLSYKQLDYGLEGGGAGRAGAGRVGALTGSDGVFGGDGGCPDKIVIGGVESSDPIFGGVDINVNISEPIIVRCKAF